MALLEKSRAKRREQEEELKKAYNVTTEEWMEFTKVKPKLNKSELTMRILVTFLVSMHVVFIAAACLGQ